MNRTASLDNCTKKFTLSDGNIVKFQWASSGVTARVKTQTGTITQIASEFLPKGLRKASSEAAFRSYLSGAYINVIPSEGQFRLNIQQNHQQELLTCKHHTDCANDLLVRYQSFRDSQECTSSSSSSSSSTLSRRELLTGLRKHIKKINRIVFLRMSFPYQTDVLTHFGQQIRAMLATYEGSNQLDKHYELFQVYLECILREGYFQQLNEALALINRLIERHIFPDKLPFLQCYKDLINVSNLLLSIENIDRLTLRFPDHYSIPERRQTRSPFDSFFDMQGLEEFQTKTASLAFMSIYWAAHSIRDKGGNRLPHAIEHYPPDYQICLGKLFLTAVNEEFRSLWDIRRTYPNFFSAALSNPGNHPEEILQLWELFKQENSTTKAAILEEMSTSSPLSTLISKLTRMTQLRSYHPADPLLPFSEYYLQESVHSEWIGHVEGKGYFITRRDENWCYLCNTEEGEMLNPGPLLAAEVLFSTSQRIYLKILKKDGWHLFNTKTGMRDDALDQIWLLAKTNQKAYLAIKKEKAITICNLTLNPTHRSFPLAISVELLADRSLIVSVKFAQHCEIWNLEQDRCIASSLNFRQVKKISNTDRFVECQGVDNNHYLLDLERETTNLISETDSVCFGDHDRVYGRKSNRDPWVLHEGKSLPIEETYLQEMGNYTLDSLSKFAGIIRYGAGFFPMGTAVVVKYTFTVETQGTYNITKNGSSQTLWIDSTVGWRRPDGGTFSLTKIEGQIKFLGISHHIYRGEKGYFFIAEDCRRYLYVSPYRELKDAIDDNCPEKPKGLEIDLPADCSDVHYLHNQFLKINIAGKWHLYRENNGIGTLFDTGYDDIAHLDGVNFIKVKRGEHWFLYDLELNFELDEPSTDIQLCSGSHRIAVVGNHSVRYIDCSMLPKEIAPLRSDVNLQEIDPRFRNNFLLNLRDPRPALQDPDVPSSVYIFLTMLTEHCLLRKILDTFLTKIIDHLIEYEVKSQENCAIEILDLSIAIATLNDQIQPLRAVNPHSNREAIRDLRHQIKLLNAQLEHLRKTASYALRWALSKETFSQHPHIWNGLLRYWIQHDPEGHSLPQFFEKLYHLTLLISRQSDYCTRRELPNEFHTINKHYIQIVMLYSFCPLMINNYIISTAPELVQETFLAIGALRGDSREKALFAKAQKVGPKTTTSYEQIDLENQEAFYGQLDQYIKLLMLISISNQLNLNDVLDTIDLAQFSHGSLHRLTQTIASTIRMSFYRQRGILTEENEEIEKIPELYLVHLMYADSMMDKSNRTLLRILLKCAVRKLDFNAIIENAVDSIPACFTAKEIVILKRITEYTRETREAFDLHTIPWEIWQQGIGERESDHFKIRIWERSPARDLFQGEYCGSCISMSKGNAKATLSYIVNKNFSMIEIIDKKNHQPIGHVTIWMALDDDDKDCVMLVMNNFQVHRRYQGPETLAFREEIQRLVFNYALEFKNRLNASRLILGQPLVQFPTSGFSLAGASSDSDSDDNSSIASEMDLEDVHPRIIGPVFGEWFYSDLFFGSDDPGWVTPETTTTVDAYDIGTWQRLFGAELGLSISTEEMPTSSSSSSSSSSI